MIGVLGLSSCLVVGVITIADVIFGMTPQLSQSWQDHRGDQLVVVPTRPRIQKWKQPVCILICAEQVAQYVCCTVRTRLALSRLNQWCSKLSQVHHLHNPPCLAHEVHAGTKQPRCMCKVGARLCTRIRASPMPVAIGNTGFKMAHHQSYTTAANRH